MRIAAFAVATAVTAQAQPLFDAAFLSYDTGTNPGSIATGDVNGDSRPDLVVANTGSPWFDVFFGRGDGTFDQNVALFDGSDAAAIVLADANGDGMLDAVLATSGNDTAPDGAVVVARGHIGGNFALGNSFAVDGVPYSLAVGDLDGGALDIVAVHTATNRISLLRGDGMLGFAAPEYTDVPGSPYSTTLGDWDGDGDFDVAVACFASDSVVVLVNAGDGTFPSRRALAVAGDPVHVRAALVNNDALLDLLVCNLEPAAISLFIGISGGDFAPRVDLALLEQPFAADLADFDGDGRTDVAVATNGAFDRPANHVTLLRGADGGGFESPRTFAASRQPRALAIADFDGDTRPDVALPGFASHTLAVLRGNGDGTFGAQVTAATQLDPINVAFGDLNGDGRGDLAVATFALDTLTVLIGQPGGGYGARADYETSAGPLAVATAQLNPDGFLDVLMVNSASNTISAYLGVGDGTLQSRSDFETGEGPTSLVVADFDRDGDADVAASNRLTNDVSVLIGRNDGFFDYKVDYPAGMRPQHLAAGDVTGDSILDLAVVNAAASTVSVLRGRGDGTFEAQVEWPVGREPRAVALGDVDGDGRLDIVTANTGGGDASVLLGQGDGTFVAQQPAEVGGVPVSIALGDVGGDGRPDLFAANDFTNAVTMLMGFGNGAFGERVEFGTGGNPRAAQLVDVDADGGLDLLLTNQSAHQVAVIRNRRDRTPVEVESFAGELLAGGEVELRWRLSGAARERLDVVRVERAPSASGTWESRAELDPGVESHRDGAVGSTMWYRLALVHRDGIATFTPPIEVGSAASHATSLHVAAASPDEIRIRFALARGPADVEIHDVRGRLVRRFAGAATAAGTHLVTWDRTDAAGHRTARGIYFVRLVTPVAAPVRRLLLL